jgi:K+-sensing histidine kinase KdpD
VKRARSPSGPMATTLGGVALATVAVGGALLPRLLVHSVLEERSTFTLFTLAVMVCARFAGPLSGVVATILSSVAGIIVFLGAGADQTGRIADALEVVLFAFVGIGITWLAQQLRAATRQAEEALEQVRMLTGLLPICAWCKKIRNERGDWQQMEQYISQHSEAKFTHGLCQECATRLQPGMQGS